MGLLIMSCRAKMVGGALEIRPGPEGGTTVRCTFSANSLEKEVGYDAAIPSRVGG